jgi:hypothetical protein
MDGTVGLAVYHSLDCIIEFRLASPSRVFNAEPTAISVALIHIFFNIPEEYVILTDNLSSIWAMESQKISFDTHLTIYECKQKVWELSQMMKQLIWRQDEPFQVIWYMEDHQLQVIFFSRQKELWFRTGSESGT